MPKEMRRFSLIPTLNSSTKGHEDPGTSKPQREGPNANSATDRHGISQEEDKTRLSFPRTFFREIPRSSVARFLNALASHLDRFTATPSAPGFPRLISFVNFVPFVDDCFSMVEIGENCRKCRGLCCICSAEILSVRRKQVGFHDH
jgi:hypothetical protein